MQPFDYRIAVQDPLQMALAGYQQGQQFQQQRVQGERETQLYNMEMQQYEANQAKLQQEQARAQQVQANMADFVGRSERGELVEGDYERFLAENYELPEPALKALEGLNERQLKERTRSLTQVSMLMASDSPEPDENSLVVKYYREQQAAAEASGDPQRAAMADAAARTYMGNPAAAKVAANATLLATDPDAFALVQPFILPKAPEAASSAGKVIADYNAGLFGEVGSPEAIQLREDQLEKAGGAQTIYVGSPVESTAFDKALGQGQADQALAISNQGTVARRNRNTLLQLRDTLAASPSGAEAGIKSFAGNFGVDTQGLSDIQAAEALISQLVPTQRAPGSGTMSDADLALYKKSLPRIINQAGGNEKIIRTTLAINEYLIKEAEIADQVINREISPSEGRAKMAALVNPLAPSGGGGATAGAGLPVINSQAAYDALPSKSKYTTPSGGTRTKP